MAEQSPPKEAERGDARPVTRRQALVGGGIVALAGGAGAAIAGCGGGDHNKYPRLKITKLSNLRPNRPVNFDYPLKGQASVLLDLGERVPGGVGERGSIVAYSALCQHMGCPVGYVPDKRHFLCGCHQSQYDPGREGVVIQGVAQRPLPRIALEVDGGDVVAVGVAGLIYGYRDNLAPGKKVA